MVSGSMKIMTQKEIKTHKENTLPLVKTLLEKIEEKVVDGITKNSMFDIHYKTFVTVLGDNMYYSYNAIEIMKKIFKVHKIDMRMTIFKVTEDKLFSYTFELDKTSSL